MSSYCPVIALQAIYAMSNVLDYKPARTVYAVIVDHWSLVFAVGCCCIARCVHMALPKLTKSQNTHTHTQREENILHVTALAYVCLYVCLRSAITENARADAATLSLSLSDVHKFIHSSRARRCLISNCSWVLL